MKLDTSHRAPNPRRLRWVMAEKGVTDVEMVEIGLLSGEHRTPEYRARVGVPHLTRWLDASKARPAALAGA